MIGRWLKWFSIWPCSFLMFFEVYNWLLGGGFFHPMTCGRWWKMLFHVINCPLLIMDPHFPKASTEILLKKHNCPGTTAIFHADVSQLNQDNIDSQGPIIPSLNPTPPTNSTGAPRPPRLVIGWSCPLRPLDCDLMWKIFEKYLASSHILQAQTWSHS